MSNNNEDNKGQRNRGRVPPKRDLSYDSSEYRNKMQQHHYQVRYTKQLLNLL